ncbi:MAG: tRNA (adenosine(37)-N6)-threonylcarbamoyltransferase complex transferase subunit TsaD [Phycisphaerales bacterium]
MGCILAIESSCDETAAAVVDAALSVRSSVVASQHELHAEYGGVVPEIASRAHLERVLPVVDRALAEAGVSADEIVAVAAGVRPGLIGSLLVGSSAAKAFAWARGLPFHAVDHVAAHLFAGLLSGTAVPAGRALGLVVSGGHTSLFLVDGPREIALIGRTIDDAVGEALDKSATMLGLPHPGGPNLEREALAGDPRALRFTKPVLPNPLDFSLSGLKTKLLYEVRGVPTGRGERSRFERDHTALSPARRSDLAASVQRAAIDQVLDRLSRAYELHAPRTLLVGGGVVSNRSFRREFAAWCLEREVALVVPEPAFCVDNAAMIAGYAQLRRAQGDLGDDLSVPAEPVSHLARGSSRARRSA